MMAPKLSSLPCPSLHAATGAALVINIFHSVRPSRTLHIPQAHTIHRTDHLPTRAGLLSCHRALPATALTPQNVYSLFNFFESRTQAGQWQPTTTATTQPPVETASA